MIWNNTYNITEIIKNKYYDFNFVLYFKLCQLNNFFALYCLQKIYSF